MRTRLCGGAPPRKPWKSHAGKLAHTHSHSRAGDSRNRMAEAFVALMRLPRQTDRITNACIILGERWQGLTWLCRELKVC